MGSNMDGKLRKLYLIVVNVDKTFSLEGNTYCNLKV